MSQKEKAQKNLENCKYLRLWKSSATLDSTKRTAVRQLPTAKNSKTVRFSPSLTTVLQFFLIICQGHTALRWLVTLPQAQNLRIISGFAVL